MRLELRLASVLVLVCALTASALAPAVAADDPPDEVNRPAAGEGEPLEDPSDPPPSGEPDRPMALYAAGGSSAPQPAVEPLAGADRYQTALAASRAGWPTGARAVVVASGEDYAEALAGAALAGAVRGPLLPTPFGQLHADIPAELERLGAQVVYLVGALDGAVRDAVVAGGRAVVEVRGEDRYDTAHRVAQLSVRMGARAETVVIASGEDFADALAASGFAAGGPYPLLLSPREGGNARLRAQVDNLGARQAFVVGGPAALPDEAVAGLPNLERAAGPDRAATAAVVGDHARARGLLGRPVVVGGEGFADALAGGVLAGGARRGPLLVTARRELSQATHDWFRRHGVAELTVLGGRASIDGLARCQLATGQMRAFLCAEEELGAQGYNVGSVDGRVDHQTAWALYAFQKVAGLRVTGRFTEAEWRAMVARPILPVRRPDLPPDHVEIDLARQLIVLVRDGRVRHVLHTSTGKPSTPTVRGTFTIYEKRNYRQSWNQMYRAVFFYRGYAMHGYPSVPLYPASHGCARTYDGDMDFLWPQLSLGERVATF